MKRTLRFAPAFALAAAAVTAAGCFVSIDESLLDKEQPTEDASSDVTIDAPDASPDSDAGLPDVKPDSDGSVADVLPDGDAGKDVVTGDADGGDAKPDADAAQPEASDDVLVEAADDGEVEASDDAEVEASDDAEVEASDDAAVDAPDDVTVDAPADGPAPWDGGLVVCADDSWCQPAGCGWRKCVNGACVDQGNMKEVTNSFDLPVGTNITCGHSYNRSCVAAVGPYLTLLTDAGPLVYNVRNPMSVRQETLPSPPAPNSMFLVRSGQRLWTVSTDTGNANVVALSWIDLPADGISAMPSFHVVKAYLGGPLNGMYAGPNDTVFLQTTSGSLPAFARFGPGLPTYLEPFPATGTSETTSAASSVHRILFHAVTGSSPYQHHFSLQNNAATSASSNSGTVDISTLSTYSSSRGFFASSRKGAVAWIIGTNDSTAWKDVRAMWLADANTATVQPSEFTIESFANVQSTNPVGPLAFIDETTVATTVIAGGSSLAPSLDIVKRTGNLAPQLVKRIAMPGSDLSGISVAGDNGYAYVVRDGKVQIYAPTCQP